MAAASLTGRQRRRLARMLRRLRADYGGCIFLRHVPEFRDAWRLGKMGLACPAVSKVRPWMPSGIGEIALCVSRAEALTTYPTWALPARSRRGC